MSSLTYVSAGFMTGQIILKQEIIESKCSTQKPEAKLVMILIVSNEAELNNRSDGVFFLLGVEAGSKGTQRAIRNRGSGK